MNKQKKRHWSLTTWLVLMLIGNSLAVLTYMFDSSNVRQYYPTAPSWAFPALTLGGILNIVFLIALFRWKKWGFWGSVAIYPLGFIVNLQVGVDVGQLLVGMSGLAILFGVLHIGKENKGWPQLE